jgi:glycosyl transferase family 25
MQVTEQRGAMPVFVISLCDAAERRKRALEQLDAAGIEFRFFDAVTPREVRESGEFRYIDEEAFLVNTGRHCVPAEIACFASHRRLWQHCVDLDMPIAILEDDFKLRGIFADALRAAVPLTEKNGFLRLQTDLRARKTAVAGSGDFTLARFTYPPHGLMGYCISPLAAGVFVAASALVDAPVDVFVKRYWQHGQPMFALLPYSLEPSDLSRKTTIPGRKKTRKPLGISLLRFARKIRCHCLRIACNARLQALESRNARPATRANTAPGLQERLPAANWTE